MKSKILATLPLLTSVILATSLLPSSVFAAPSCNWNLSNIETELVSPLLIHQKGGSQNVSDDRLIIDSYKCEIENYDTSNISEIKKASVIGSDRRLIPIEISTEYIGIEILDTDNSLPIRALKFSRPGSSNVGSSVRIYDSKWNILKTINNPVNKYQATNRKGSESEIVGFFKSGDEMYIENIRSLGGECGACQRYVVDTYKVTGGDVSVVGTRDFDITDFERYNNK